SVLPKPSPLELSSISLLRVQSVTSCLSVRCSSSSWRKRHSSAMTKVLSGAACCPIGAASVSLIRCQQSVARLNERRGATWNEARQQDAQLVEQIHRDGQQHQIVRIARGRNDRRDDRDDHNRVAAGLAEPPHIDRAAAPPQTDPP